MRARAKATASTPVKKHKLLVPLRTKCSLSMVASTMMTIYGDKKKVKLIQDMGFDSLLHIKCKHVPREYIVGLLRHFNPKTRMLTVDCSSPFEVTIEAVGRVLGIPSTGRDVLMQLTDKELRKLDKYRKLSLKELTASLISESRSLNFHTTVLAFFLAVFLCPTTKDVCSNRLLPAISVAQQAKEYNWAKFVLDWLVQQVNKSNKVKRKGNSKAQSLGVGECVLLLVLFYFDKVPLPTGEGALVTTWTDKHVAKRIEKEKKVKDDLLLWISRANDALSNMKRIAAKWLFRLDVSQGSIQFRE